MRKPGVLVVLIAVIAGLRYSAFDQQEYLNLGNGGCAAYDPASFQTFRR
jgi:hypothetical protein